MTIDDTKTVPRTRAPSLADGESNAKIEQPPQGWKRLAWLGPSFLWMVSAAGSGELLFTPRVGALYGYALLWALLTAVVLKWFIKILATGLRDRFADRRSDFALPDLWQTRGPAQAGRGD